MKFQANLHNSDGAQTGRLDYELMDYAPMVMFQIDNETHRVQAYLRKDCVEDGETITARYDQVTSERFDLSLDVSKRMQLHNEYRRKQAAMAA